MDFTTFFPDLINFSQQLSSGMWNTLQLFLGTIIISLPLGLVVTACRMNKWAPLAKVGSNRGLWGKVRTFRPLVFITKIFISILRGTPLMLQTIVVFYGPFYLFGMRLSPSYRIIALLLAFGINYAAYFGEIFRGGIESIPVGQYEAAQVLGYSKAQTFFKIILPQMFKRVLPAVTNESITLVKDTSLAFVITYTEMFTMAKQIAAAQTTILPLFVAGIFYYIFNAIVAGTMDSIERRMAYYQ